jgi:hypothetical protein
MTVVSLPFLSKDGGLVGGLPSTRWVTLGWPDGTPFCLFCRWPSVTAPAMGAHFAHCDAGPSCNPGFTTLHVAWCRGEREVAHDHGFDDDKGSE